MATELLLLLALGAIAVVANALSAFAGGGAGLVQLPALILLGLPFASALATHKLASVALGLGAAGRHWRASSLDPRLCLLVLLAGLPGVWIGASSVLALPDRIASAALGLLTWPRCIQRDALNSVNTIGRDPQRPPAADRCSGAVWHRPAQRLPDVRHGPVRHPLARALVRPELPKAVAHTLILVGLAWMAPVLWCSDSAVKSTGAGCPLLIGVTWRVPRAHWSLKKGSRW